MSRRRFDVEVLAILIFFTVRTSAGGAIEQNSFGLSDAKGVKQLGVFYGQFDHLVKTMWTGNTCEVPIIFYVTSKPL